MPEVSPVWINGRFLTQPLSGMQRYAGEMVSALDDLLEADEDLRGRFRPVVLVPRGRRREPGWRRIPIRTVGRLAGHAWDQIELARAARGGVLINLAAAGPLMHERSILVLHDAAIFEHPEHFTRHYGLLHRFLRPLLARRAMGLATISEFSRQELARWCGVGPERFSILGDSAEHILKVEPDPTILDRNGLRAGRYALTVGNQSPNKNVGLAIRAFSTAAPAGWRLAVAGGGSERIFGAQAGTAVPAVARLGRVTDEELRALYEHAGLFLFPSRYEGFGVPPLEAMTLGCPVISSDAAAMKEILGDAAVFFRSDDEEDLVSAIRRLVADDQLRQALAERGRARASLYRWSDGAARLAELAAR